ncbi:MAG TPA: hypothetical protein VKP88_01210 [Candidatus Paceibacterota bacterium]|nr:hypothetical protein [Candidatus Paceibacterota bacterium]
MMKQINRPLATVSCWLVFAPISAHAVVFIEQADVFTPDQLANPVAAETYYGELTDWPHTFTFTVREEVPVRYTLATAPDSEPVSLLLVREVQRGVEEVVRQTADTTTWQPRRDRRLGVALATAPALETTLTPGSYKLEVSNAVNQGRYQLQIGEGSQGGFFTTIADTFAVHDFYGHWVTALTTWRVLFVLAIFLGATVWFWRRYRTGYD